MELENTGLRGLLEDKFFGQTIDFCSQKLKSKGNSLNYMGDALPPGFKRECSFFSFFFLMNVLGSLFFDTSFEQLS